jgi:uncharacterized protein (TIGR03066 family)
MGRAFIAACLVACVGMVSAAPPPKAPAKKTEQELIVGVWKLTETTQGNKADLFLWFDGKGGMAVNRKLDKTGWGYDARYEIKDKELPYESVSPNFTHKETLKVLTLTEDVFEYEDPDGIREKFQRVKDEPKK